MNGLTIRKKGAASLAAVLIALGLAGCEARIANRGFTPDAEDIAAIQPGMDSREDILRRFGSPSSTAAFRNDTWYYVGQRMETYAFYKPEVTERNVLVVQFDENGIVKDKKHLTLADGKEVELVERETPTEGRELTFLEQIFGNFGRLPSDFADDSGGLNGPI